MMIIAGPCSIESEKQIEIITKFLSSLGIKYLRGGAFKPRTSPNSFQGYGNKALSWIKNSANKYNMKTVIEITDIKQLENNYDKIDIIQIGSRNMTSFEFLKNLGKLTSKDKKPILLKRGMNSTLNEFILASKYISNEGNNNIIYCLRGIRTFEQIDSEFRFTPDLGSILELKKLTKNKIIFDPSHSSGKSEFVSDIAKAAISLGTEGLIIEVHNNPKEALSDKEQALTFSEFKKLIDDINVKN